MLVLDAVSFAHRTPAKDTAPSYRFALAVPPGTIAGLTGPSGAGKSTLLDLVAGFLTPASGAITLDGRSLLGLAPEARPVSILFQSDAVFAHLTVARNARLGVPPRLASDAVIEETLARMGVGGLGRRRAATLSGGQRQRVALARTLLRDKPVLLLDEPFTGIDADAVAPLRTLIVDLVRERGWHAILVSHDETDIAAMSDTRYRLVAGRTERIA